MSADSVGNAVYLRMVAAWKPAADGQTELTHQDLQQGVILLGIAGMMDPHYRFYDVPDCGS
ncbi:hypothetical protein ABK730_11430 [Klebsiella indica]|uniref:Uncharacterized protein n=1 Tax=Klebsiella indica TaxID=2582917 RepID=A0A5R9LFX3_9ENTR|nr:MULTISPECIES: hypothetical protein [Klebsiella]TLV15640.1 hypothetical protein FE839_14670 [Klebsiella indica]